MQSVTSFMKRMNNAQPIQLPWGTPLMTKTDVRRCLTVARVPSFNGEKIDLKPAITSFYVYFYVISFFSPLKLGTRASLRHVVCHNLKDGGDSAEPTQTDWDLLSRKAVIHSSKLPCMP